VNRARSRRSTPLSLALLKKHPLPPVAAAADKEDRGAVLIVGGSFLVPGAAILAGLAALRAGCGKLAIAIDNRVSALTAQSLPEALVLPLAPSHGNSLAAALRDKAQTADAILVGVGMQPSAATARLVRQIARASDAPLVLDAGALARAAMPVLPRRRCVLTPHAGEMAKLTGSAKTSVQAQASTIAQTVAHALEATVVLKGAQTFIADTETLLRNDRGHPGLGTSGSGDVLAGVLAALVARGASPRWAAAWAVWLHALAGERLARRIGPTGFLAREIAHEIPRCLRACGQR